MSVGVNKTQRLTVRNTNEIFERTKDQAGGLDQLLVYNEFVAPSFLTPCMCQYSRRHREALTNQKTPAQRRQEATWPSMKGPLHFSVA